LSRDGFHIAVDHQHPGRGAEREIRRERRIGDHGAHAGVRKDVLDALAWKLRVDRHVAGTRLQDAEQRREQEMRFGEVETNQGATADALPAQPVRELIGQLVELFIGQPSADSLDGRVHRPAGNLGLEEFVQEGRVPDRGTGAGGRGEGLRADINERHSDHPATSARRQSCTPCSGFRARDRVWSSPSATAKHTSSPCAVAVPPPTATAT
jgi:hypothetical protein